MFWRKLPILGVLLLLGLNVLAADPLPRVLVLGDSLYLNLTSSKRAAEDIKKRAQIVYANPADTSYALANLHEWLGKDKWSVIHFNLGLADLCYKDPRLKGIRAMSKAAGGVRVSSPEVYQKNLSELVRRLQATGAKLIWASTTAPTTHGGTNYDADSEIEYNAIAAKIMAAQNIPVNDMQAIAVAAAKEKKPPQFDEPFITAIVAALESVKK